MGKKKYNKIGKRKKIESRILNRFEENSFIMPCFMERSGFFEKEGLEIESIENFYRSLYDKNIQYFFLVDGKLMEDCGDKGIYFGGGGMGKSIMMNIFHLANKEHSLLFSMKDYREGNGWINQIKEKCNTNKKVWALFDGLNEMNVSDFNAFNNEIEGLAADNKKLKMIFSARNEKIFENLKCIHSLGLQKRIYEICYKQEQFEHYFKQNNVTMTANLQRILKTPLLASLYVKTMHTLSSIVGDIEKVEFVGIGKGESLYSSGEVLWNYVYAQKYRDFEDKVQKDVDRIILEFLPQLAHNMRKLNLQAINLSDYCKFISDTLNKKNTKNSEIEKMVHIAANNLNLLIETQITNFNDVRVSFIHEEFLDFFAALYLVFQVNECIEHNLLYCPGQKNSTKNVRRYVLEMQNGFFWKTA